MHIYRCELTLMEATFFSSREVSNTYQTEPLIGHIALAYAFGLCRSPYTNHSEIHYKKHLEALNQAGIYVTPATIAGQPRFTLAQFNAQADAYWYAMANNVIVTRPDGTWAEKRGAAWYIKRNDRESGKKVGLENRPQHGRIRMLAIGNRAVAYILSQEPLTLPAYIRLGKFMSKAKVKTEEMQGHKIRRERVHIPFLLSPADLPQDIEMLAFDLINVPPTPLIRNAVLTGDFYQLSDHTLLPAEMHFGIDRLP